MPSADSPVAVDTSVLVAALLAWHRDHPRALPLLDAAIASGALLLPSRVLTESYAVMTRMPAPHRLAPAVAFGLLDGTLREAATVIELPADDRWSFLEGLADDEVAGGAAYDSEILATALHAGARRLLTLNPRDFERFSPEDIEIVSGE